MKHKIKRSILPLAALGFCMNAYAADNDDYDYSDYYDSAADEATEAMTIPENHQGIRASVTYLLGQPTYNSSFLDITSKNELSLGRIRPAFTQSGLAASLAYDFSNGKFVQADWMQFFGNSQTQASDVLSIQRRPIPKSIQSIGTTRSTFTRIGADLGQQFHAGDNLLYRLSFGAQYTRIGISEDSLLNVVPGVMGDQPTDPFQLSVYDRTSVFNGIGPRVGLSAEYDIGWNFKLVGGSSASLNIGNIKATTTTQLREPEQGERVHTEATDSFRTVVPGLEGNLGVRYDYGLGDRGVLSTEIGYQAIGYFNTFSGTRDAFISGRDRTSINSPSSYGNQAVYLKLAYNGSFS